MELTELTLKPLIGDEFIIIFDNSMEEKLRLALLRLTENDSVFLMMYQQSNPSPESIFQVFESILGVGKVFLIKTSGVNHTTSFFWTKQKITKEEVEILKDRLFIKRKFILPEREKTPPPPKIITKRQQRKIEKRKAKKRK